MPPGIFTHVPSEAAGKRGVAVRVLLPPERRYADGAPIVIHVPGGVQPGTAIGPPEFVGLGFVEIFFAFPGGGRGEQSSGGTYDYRGPTSVRALADVIRFATGRAADQQGRKIGDLAGDVMLLPANCGLIGSSHGGNACGVVMAKHGEEFPDLAFYVSMESPYGQGAVNVELGGFQSGVNPAYDSETGKLDLSLLAWSDELAPTFFRPTARAAGGLKGALYFDIDRDSTFDRDQDFPANVFVGDVGQGVKAYYSPRLLKEAEKRRLFGENRPPHNPTAAEAEEFWSWRDAAGSIAEAVRKFPRLAVIVYAGERDHVQAAPDHPHILTQVEGFRLTGAAFVRLNPDRCYVERLLLDGPQPPRGRVPSGWRPFADNDAGRSYDRSSIREALEPAGLPIGLFVQAAVCEAADRVQAKNWSNNLDAVLYADAPWEARVGRPPGRLPQPGRARGPAGISFPNPPAEGRRELGPRPFDPRWEETPETEAALTRHIASDAGSLDAPLLIGIGVHVEPFGAVVSPRVREADQLGEPTTRESPFPPRVQPGGRRGFRRRPDYHEVPFFRRHVEDLQTLAKLVERHGGKLTVQAQTPFTEVAVDRNERILADFEKRGHEIALHFHEDAHLGRGSHTLPVETWAAVMKDEIELLRQAEATEVRYWSGGNLYPHVLDAAAEAGLEVMSDHKNPRQQRTDVRLLGVVPWRPAGGPKEDDVSDFARHDPHGKIIYLPDGRFPRVDFNAMRRSPTMGGEWRYFDFLTTALEDSLRAARPDRVNVFHITVHAGEFRGRPGSSKPFAVIDQWLTEIVDPLTEAGKVRWATFSEMAKTYVAWEEAHSGVDPLAGAATAEEAPEPGPAAEGTRREEPQGYITFVINVHDWCHAGESADTVLRLIDVFEKYDVRGDFYLTAPLVEAYALERPKAIERLRESDMTISYHFRPPHPGYTGFGGRLRELDDQVLSTLLRDYETYRLDLATGDLDRNKPGGYAYVAKMLGRPPVVVSALSANPRVKTTLLDTYREMGARMTMEYHETGTDPDRPFEWRRGLLIRPSDFSITRWRARPQSRAPTARLVRPGERQESFWWNQLDSPRAAEFNPTAHLRRQMAAWDGPRPPIITALIHENNFCRKGPAAWTFVYYSGADEGRPLSPPFDLQAADRSRPRTPQEAEAIWEAYEELVAYASRHLDVVTSADLVEMAAEEPNRGG